MRPSDFVSTFPVSYETHAQLVSDPGFRESIYRVIHPTPRSELLPLVRVLFQHEVAYRQDETHDGTYFENLYWTAAFLYQIGDLDDVIPMWRAKRINMDTGGGFSIQFLLGAGLETTLKFLRLQKTEEAESVAKYLEECSVAGDFEDMNAWFSDTIGYFD